MAFIDCNFITSLPTVNYEVVRGDSWSVSSTFPYRRERMVLRGLPSYEVAIGLKFRIVGMVGIANKATFPDHACRIFGTPQPQLGCFHLTAARGKALVHN